jgi:ABC-type transport system involved in multi-copper enzyme maturation permease subunit
VKKIRAICLNTFRESIRDRVFFSLLGFAVLMLGFSMILSNLAVGDNIKIIKDFGLGSISIFGTLIAIFVGIGLLYKEMDKRTIFIILSKPVSRPEFLLGKYLGLSLTLMVEVSVMTVALFLLLYAHTQTIPWDLLKAIIPICMELEVVLVVALFFSAFATPFLSGFFTLGVFIIGHLSRDLITLTKTMKNPIMSHTCNLIYYLFPNFSNFNFKTQVVHNLPITAQEFGLALIYGMFYILFLFFLTVLIFKKKDM